MQWKSLVIVLFCFKSSRKGSRDTSLYANTELSGTFQLCCSSSISIYSIRVKCTTTELTQLSKQPPTRTNVSAEIFQKFALKLASLYNSLLPFPPEQPKNSQQQILILPYFHLNQNLPYVYFGSVIRFFSLSS